MEVLLHAACCKQCPDLPAAPHLLLRMVSQRQLAERWRVAGNEAYSQCQWSEALRCYGQGLEAQRHSMALHANAAMACLKLKCYVQAMEHCDKVREWSASALARLQSAGCRVVLLAPCAFSILCNVSD